MMFIGGPLVLDDDSRTLIGLTSFGSGAGCHHGHPVVFTRVTYFMNWIRSIVNVDLPEENRIWMEQRQLTIVN